MRVATRVLGISTSVLAPALVAAVWFSAPASVTTRAATVPTFSKDVAPILFKSCVECHRQSGMAPMSLMTYDDVRPWARAVRNRVVSRDRLLECVWGYDRVIETRSVDVHIGRLRGKLKIAGQQIETIVGLGYRFIE